ncbi:MAG: phosphatidate cytidylyltransferase, partial [Chlamydiota bacterium]|nr:phosphatidate cytidylyltransferase [Chlamydiota bacterium]
GFALIITLSMSSLLELTLFDSLWVGILLSLVSQMGDLLESFLKRKMEKKESGIIPGMGGLLDMTDSLLTSTPVVYCLMMWKAQ